MLTQAIARSSLLRLRHPAAWGTVAGFQVVWLVTRLLSGVPLEKLETWEFFIPALFLLGHLALAPAPWQWTGEGTAVAPIWRGGLQALIWNTAWVFLLLWGVQDFVRPTRPAPPRRAEDVGRPAPPRPRQASDGPPNPPPPGLPQELKLLSLNLPFALVLGWFLAGKERAESSEEELREKERQARTLALQAQLHPHALYNVLGGLAELVHEDPDAAEQAIIGLVDLLRTLTRHGNTPSLPLAQERALLRRYLSIESIRLGDRLQVRWDWPEWADALRLPPLLLQPLVENAVKHGISPSPSGGELHVGVRRQGVELVLWVANTGAVWNPAAPEGTGISNLRERLSLLPHPGASLEIHAEAGRTLAEVRLGGNLPA